jgi:hypothetical protein
MSKDTSAESHLFLYELTLDIWRFFRPALRLQVQCLIGWSNNLYEKCSASSITPF